MEDRNILREERLQRIQTFGNLNKADWPAGSKPAICFASIDAILADLGKAKVGQLRLPTTKQTYIDALWLDFKNIARTARAIALDEPGFAAPYRLPDDANEIPVKTHADSLLKLLEDNAAPRRRRRGHAAAESRQGRAAREIHRPPHARRLRRNPARGPQRH